MYVLLQFGTDPFNNKFEDLESRPAFTVKEVERNPNIVVRITREPEWSQQHPGIMGPNKSFLYFGPDHSLGYLVYGNSPTQPMSNSVRQKREGSTSRYFTAQNGRDYKWKISPTRMECIEGRSTTIAVWERSHPRDEYHARLTIRPTGLAVVTEILTTLTLNHISQLLKR